ncbi:hypothetical protein ACFCYM_35095 [Streptomyces sp. NPDC056254]|uniref:hypothetical protein n=1 Tax=Streptomyces sp. NPDC056254 TaxID=3345763 RepID=UPI0035D6DFB6
MSTAHKAKGREWPTVQIADGLRPPKDSARKADQIVQDLEKRETARAKAAEQKSKAVEREKSEAARRAKQKPSEDLRREATERTAEAEAQLDHLASVLTRRATGLHAHRLPVQKALLSGGADAMTNLVEAALARVGYPGGASWHAARRVRPGITRVGPGGRATRASCSTCHCAVPLHGLGPTHGCPAASQGG